ncbi:MAG: ABC transporter substrate-binding protein [Xanthobacteraceae bacterium]
MRRRAFIALIGGAAAWPLLVRAQRPVIGFLSSASRQPFAHYVAAFGKGLKEEGYVEGENVTVEYRWAEGHYDRLPTLADELVGRNVAVIVASGGDPPALAAKAATSTIPIVFTATINDPVKLGLVASLNRPGGNITGFNILTAELNAKRLEFLRELIPKSGVIGVLVNSNSPTAEHNRNEVSAAARAVGQPLAMLSADSDGEIETAIATLVQRQAAAILVVADPFFNSRRNELVAMMARHAVPAIYSLREYAAAGGLITYGPSVAEGYRLAGLYAGQILKGAKPADLPVQQSTKFELIINLRTAKALGMEVPAQLLARADEVIE